MRSNDADGYFIKPSNNIYNKKWKQEDCKLSTVWTGCDNCNNLTWMRREHYACLLHADSESAMEINGIWTLKALEVIHGETWAAYY